MNKDFSKSNFDQTIVNIIEKLLNQDDKIKEIHGMKKISSTDSNFSDDEKVQYIIYKDFATVYFLNYDNKKYIIKKFDRFHYEYYMNEVNFLCYLDKSDLTPIFYYHYHDHCKEKIYIVTEQYDGDVLSLLTDENTSNETILKIVQEINKKLLKLNLEYGVNHNDMKYNNIVYKKHEDFYKFAFIDFTLSELVLKNKTYINLFDNDYIDFIEHIKKKQFHNWLGSPLTRFQQLRDIETNDTDDIKTLSINYKLLIDEKNKNKLSN